MVSDARMGRVEHRQGSGVTVDPLGRAAHRAIDAYCSSAKPNAQLEHALFEAVMSLAAARSGLVVTMRIGEGQITRKPA